MKEISAALVKAQKEFGPALKTHTNPAFRSKYANLSACIEAVIDALNNNGIFLMQPTHDCNDGVIVETIFVHESGEQMSSGKLHVPATKHDAQGYGSALTYARRYSLMTACGIAPEDDDGNAASKPAPKAEPAPKPVAAPVGKPPAKIEGNGKNGGEWQIKITTDENTPIQTWISLVNDSVEVMLEVAKSKDDVMNIFKNNRNIFDKLKLESEESHKAIMDKFAAAKKSFEETK
jgi:hypothetical protein